MDIIERYNLKAVTRHVSNCTNNGAVRLSLLQQVLSAVQPRGCAVQVYTLNVTASSSPYSSSSAPALSSPMVSSRSRGSFGGIVDGVESGVVTA